MEMVHELILQGIAMLMAITLGGIFAAYVIALIVKLLHTLEIRSEIKLQGKPGSHKLFTLATTISIDIAEDLTSMLGVNILIFALVWLF